MACSSNSAPLRILETNEDVAKPDQPDWVPRSGSPPLFVSDNPETVYGNHLSGVLWQHTAAGVDINQLRLHRTFFWHVNELERDKDHHGDRVLAVTIENLGSDPIVVAGRRAEIISPLTLSGGICLADVLLSNALRRYVPPAGWPQRRVPVGTDPNNFAVLFTWPWNNGARFSRGGQLDFIVWGERQGQVVDPEYRLRTVFAPPGTPPAVLARIIAPRLARQVNPVTGEIPTHPRGGWPYSEVHPTQILRYEIPAQGAAVAKSFNFPSVRAGRQSDVFTESESADHDPNGLEAISNRAPYGAILLAQLEIHNRCADDRTVTLLWQPRALSETVANQAYAGATEVGLQRRGRIRRIPPLFRVRLDPQTLDKDAVQSALIGQVVVRGLSTVTHEVVLAPAGAAQTPVALVVVPVEP